jgi:hypothetical protein
MLGPERKNPLRSEKAETMYQEMGMGLYLGQTKEILARL